MPSFVNSWIHEMDICTHGLFPSSFSIWCNVNILYVLLCWHSVSSNASLFMNIACRHWKSYEWSWGVHVTHVSVIHVANVITCWSTISWLNLTVGLMNFTHFSALDESWDVDFISSYDLITNKPEFTISIILLDQSNSSF